MRVKYWESPSKIWSVGKYVSGEILCLGFSLFHNSVNFQFDNTLNPNKGILSDGASIQMAHFYQKVYPAIDTVCLDLKSEALMQKIAH